MRRSPKKQPKQIKLVKLENLKTVGGGTNKSNDTAWESVSGGELIIE